MKNKLKTFGSRFKTIRKCFNLTQIEFAKRLKYTESSTITNIEKGKITLTTKKLLLLNELFNVDINWLLTGEGSMFLPHRKNIYSKDSNIEKAAKESIEYVKELVRDKPAKTIKYIQSLKDIVKE